MLSFLAPLFLIGLGSAAIPLLIHLSRSRRTKKIRFSTTRFFTDQFLRTYRMSRLKELLLLAVRMALCALFAAALARPLFLPPGRSLLLGRSRAVVLVVDNSASMGYEEAGQTPLARARAAAVRLLDDLGPGDTASVVLAARRAGWPQVLFPQPTPELADVRQAMEGLSPAALGTDLSAAVRRAEEVLRQSAAESKEVYVLSDLQDAGWELRDEAAAADEDARNLYFFVRLRPERTENLALTAVRYAAARPMVGVPFSIRPHVRNDGPVSRSATVRLVVDGQKVAEKRLDEATAGRWAVPRFSHAFDRAGWHSGYVEIDDAGFTDDDRRYFAFEVLKRVEVLAVNGAPSAVARLDELYFLRTALAAAAGGESPLRLTEAAPAELPQAELAKYALVVLANVESLPAAAVERLEAYADAGGSVLFFLGDKAAPAAYNGAFAAPARLHGGLLPGKLTTLIGDPAADGEAARVGAVDDAYAAASSADDEQLAAISGVSFAALWGIDPGDSAVPMRTADGAPLLCEKSYGKGRVVLFASTCDRDWTNFPVRPAFLPWLYRLVGRLAQPPLADGGFFVTGDIVPLPVSAAEGIARTLVKLPDGTLAAPRAGTADAPLVFDATDQTGVYELLDPVAPSGQASLFVANLDPYESDLTYLDDVLAGEEFVDAADSPQRDAAIADGLRELLPGRPLVTYVADENGVQQASLAARRGWPLWNLLLLLVLAIALFEPWLANRISQRHYSKPKEIAAMPVGAGRVGRLNRTDERQGAEEASLGRPAR